MKRIELIPSESKGKINRNIYGHFSEHIGGVFYDGLWVGEDSEIPNYGGFRKSIVDAMREIKPPVLRWPGGCFAETYDWRDGIGPRDKRPVTLNWWYNNDKRTESNQVGTHEFVRLCRLIGAEPYFAANITSTTPLEIRNWMEYCNAPEKLTSLAAARGDNGDAQPFAVKYWGIGNENWGGGGNMTPEMYARRYIQYATVCNIRFNDEKYIACGANAGDVAWTNRFMAEFRNAAPLYALAFHYYCGSAGDPLKFTEAEWYQMLDKAAVMDSLIKRHRSAMRTYDPDGRIKIIVDEWGCWHPGGSGPSKGYNLFEQQSTVRDAMVTALTLNIFNDHCDIVDMANVAQLCNNLHCLFLAGGDKMTVTPTYHVFKMFKGHQDARHIFCAGEKDGLTISASEKDGKYTITAGNLSYNKTEELKLSLFGGKLNGKANVTVLTHEDPHAHNTFDEPDKVHPVTSVIDIDDDTVYTLPPASITLIEIA
ncbi:MAG: alpha-N-arabinofuranosidase [Clostridiales bacterium]|nr:alpha-N-arabinofuranosidase [Clostridiales bacterium]